MAQIRSRGRRGVGVAIDLPGTPLGERSELLFDPGRGLCRIGVQSRMIRKGKGDSG